MHTFKIGMDSNENYPPTFPRIIKVSDRLDRPPTLISLTIEKRRLSNPLSKTRPFNYGDYCPLDYSVQGQKLIGIDKKGSGHELLNNLNGPQKERARFLRSLDLFTRCVKYPYIWLDMDFNDLWTKAPVHAKRSGFYDPTPTYCRLFHELMGRNIGLIGPCRAKTPQQRFDAGKWLAHFLYARCHPSWITPSSMTSRDPIKNFQDCV